MLVVVTVLASMLAAARLPAVLAALAPRILLLLTGLVLAAALLLAASLATLTALVLLAALVLLIHPLLLARKNSA